MLAKSIMIGAVALACVSFGQAIADESGAVRQRGAVVVPEHHVIEVSVDSPLPRRFIINGHVFTARSDTCLGWHAGHRVSMVSGDWHGWCYSAVFHNRTLRRDCEMYCGYFGFF